jgi:hypothetical protein
MFILFRADVLQIENGGSKDLRNVGIIQRTIYYFTISRSKDFCNLLW